MRADRLSKSYGRQRVLDGLSLELRAGEVALLRGDNGAGKTTLLNILTGSLEPQFGSITYFTAERERRYEFPRRQRLFNEFTPEAIAGLNVSRSWQDVRLFGGQSVKDNIVLARRGQMGENPLRALLAAGRIRSAERSAAEVAKSLLEGLGLAHMSHAYADSISLGEAKRVALARAVAAGAKVLFLDEPFSGLDKRSARDVLSLLERLVQEQGVTLVIVEHSPHPDLCRLVTTDWILRDGELVQKASANASTGARNELVGALAGLAGPPVDTPFGEGAVLRRFRLPKRQGLSSTPALEVEGLVVNRGRRAVFGREGSIGFALGPGEVGVIEAYNGWGKSTLLAAIAGVLPIEAGRIYVGGEPVQGLEPWDRARRGLQFLPAGDFDFPNLTLREVFDLAAGRPSAPSAEGSERMMSTLSGGEARKLAMRLLGSATATLLDEPLSRLDETASETATKRLLDPDLGALLITVPSA